jgi:hypothetical protein
MTFADQVDLSVASFSGLICNMDMHIVHQSIFNSRPFLLPQPEFAHAEDSRKSTTVPEVRTG